MLQTSYRISNQAIFTPQLQNKKGQNYFRKRKVLISTFVKEDRDNLVRKSNPVFHINFS